MKTSISTFANLVFFVLISAVAFAQSPPIVWDYNVSADKSDILSMVIKTSDGGYLMAGYSNSSGILDKTEDTYGTGDWPPVDYWIVKISQDGSRQWDKTFGGDNDDKCTAVIQTGDGGYLLAGYSNSGISGVKTEASNGGYDFWVVKTDKDGNLVWDKTIGGTGDEECNAAIEISENNYLLAGTTTTASNGGKDYWFVKIHYDESAGNVITDWYKNFGGTKDDVCTSVVATEDGYMLAGYSYSDFYSGVKSDDCRGYSDFWLLKTDFSGVEVWDKTFGGNKHDLCNSLINTNDGGVLLAGTSQSDSDYEKTEDPKGAEDYWIVKLDPDGDIEWDKTLGGKLTNNNMAAHNHCYSAIQLSDGGYLLGGSSDAYADEDGDKTEDPVTYDDYSGNWLDFWIVKIASDGNKEWDKTIGGTDYDACYVVLESDDGEYLAGGISRSAGTGDNTGDSYRHNDYWIVKLEESSSPEITISGPVDPVSAGTNISLTLEYTGTPATCTIDWGDGNTDENSDVAPNLFNPAHTYNSPGVYTVSATITNVNGVTDTETYQYIVVYDPLAGFVTGGGWINSPEGAYAQDPSLTGQANFGFVSKYKKGQSTPDGNTEFQFKAGNLNFKSTLYDWLVIAGSKAIFKGEGTINGEGWYGFMLSAVDAELSESTNADLFRIKIWNKEAEDVIVYDNNIDNIEDDAVPATAIGGGSIVIHSADKKIKSAEIANTLISVENQASLNVYPNPFSKQLNFEFLSPEDGNVRIDVYDLSGRLIKTVFNGRVQKAVTYTPEFIPELSVNEIFIYRMILGEIVYTGKAIYKK